MGRDLGLGDTPCGPRRMALPDDSWKLEAEIMTARDQTRMTDRERAEEKVRTIIEELDRPTLALLYRTLHDALGFRIESTNTAIAKLGG